MSTKTMALLDENNVVVDIAIYWNEEPETEKLVTCSEENYATISGDYFEGKFYPPKPYPSWVRGEIVIGHKSPVEIVYGPGWVPPVGFHEEREEIEGKEYEWNESEQKWDLINNT